MKHEFEHDWNDLSILDSKLIDKAFKTDEEKEAYSKYWAPGEHEDIGLFWNQSFTNKLK